MFSAGSWLFLEDAALLTVTILVLFVPFPPQKVTFRIRKLGRAPCFCLDVHADVFPFADSKTSGSYELFYQTQES